MAEYSEYWNGTPEYGIGECGMCIDCLNEEIQRLKNELATSQNLERIWKGEYEIARASLAQAREAGVRLLVVCAPQVEPLDSVTGVISQIDNYIAGLQQRCAQAQAERDAALNIAKWHAKDLHALDREQRAELAIQSQETNHLLTIVARALERKERAARAWKAAAKRLRGQITSQFGETDYRKYTATQREYDKRKASR